MQDKIWPIIRSSSFFRPVKILISVKNCNQYNTQIMSLMVILLLQKMLKLLFRKLPIKIHQLVQIIIFMEINPLTIKRKVNRLVELENIIIKIDNSQ